jgi:hypothetical protein
MGEVLCSGRSASLLSLITISREYGAGGSGLGVLLGKALGWSVLDHELVRQLAARLKYEEGEVKAMDEHAPSSIRRLAPVAVTRVSGSRDASAPPSISGYDDPVRPVAPLRSPTPRRETCGCRTSPPARPAPLPVIP